MKLSVGMFLATLAFAYQSQATNFLPSDQDPGFAINNASGTQNKAPADGETATTLVWIRRDAASSTTSTIRPYTSCENSISGVCHNPSKPPGGGQPPKSSSKGNTKSQVSSDHPSQNRIPPETKSQPTGIKSSPHEGPGNGRNGHPSSSKNHDHPQESNTHPSQGSGPSTSKNHKHPQESNTHPSQGSGPSSNGNGPESPSTRNPPGNLGSQTSSPSPSPSKPDSDGFSSSTTVTGESSTTAAPVIQRTTVAITKGHKTSSVVFTGTSVTTSKGSKPTLAWGCSKELSKICGSGGGSSSGCLVPLLCPKDKNWGFGGGWAPSGNPPAGGPPPPSPDPEPGHSDGDDDGGDDNDHSKTTATQETTSTTSTTSSSTSTTSSASKFNLCLTVYEGTGTITSTTASSTSSATATSTSKFNLCLTVYEGSGTIASTTPTSSTSSATATSTSKFNLCLTVYEGSGTITESTPKSTTNAGPTTTRGPLCTGLNYEDGPHACACSSTVGKHTLHHTITKPGDKDCTDIQIFPISSFIKVPAATAYSDICVNTQQNEQGKAGAFCQCSTTMHDSSTINVVSLPYTMGTYTIMEQCAEITEFPNTTPTSTKHSSSTPPVTLTDYTSTDIGNGHVYVFASATPTLDTTNWGGLPDFTGVKETNGLGKPEFESATNWWSTTDGTALEYAKATATGGEDLAPVGKPISEEASHWTSVDGITTYIFQKATATKVGDLEGSGTPTATIVPSPTATCAMFDNSADWMFAIYNIANWDVKPDKLEASLRDQEKGCGDLTQWDYDADTKYGPAAKFALPFFMKAGCVERAIHSAGGPKADGWSCGGPGGLHLFGTQDSVQDILEHV